MYSYCINFISHSFSYNKHQPRMKQLSLSLWTSRVTFTDSGVNPAKYRWVFIDELISYVSINLTLHYLYVTIFSYETTSLNKDGHCQVKSWSWWSDSGPWMLTYLPQLTHFVAPDQDKQMNSIRQWPAKWYVAVEGIHPEIIMIVQTKEKTTV